MEQIELITKEEAEALNDKQKSELEKAEEMHANTEIDFPKIKEVKYKQLELF